LHLRPRPENADDTGADAGAAEGFQERRSPHQEVVNGSGNRRYLIERAGFIGKGFERGFLIMRDVTADLIATKRSLREGHPQHGSCSCVNANDRDARGKHGNAGRSDDCQASRGCKYGRGNP